MRIASVLVILLGVISILALRGILGSDTAFSGLSEAEDGPVVKACSASTRFLACEVAGRCFTGTVVGLYAFSDADTKAVMEVSAFSMGPKEEG